jgi:hypothetical protein
MPSITAWKSSRERRKVWMCRASASSDSFVGDIVDRAAERVDLVHRVALRGGKDAHREIERASRRRFRSVGSRIVGDDVGNGQDELRCGAPTGKLRDQAPVSMQPDARGTTLAL